MNRLTIAAAIAAAACAVTIPTVAALASDNTSSQHGPAHSTIVDDRSATNRGSDDAAPSLSPSSTSHSAEPGDDRDRHAEPGDDTSSDDSGHHHRGHSG
jgi:hypothetical protein